MQREHMNALEGKAIRDKRNINIVCNPRNTTIESIMSAANRQVNTIFRISTTPASSIEIPSFIPLVKINSIRHHSAYDTLTPYSSTRSRCTRATWCWRRPWISLCWYVLPQRRESGKLTCAVQGGVSCRVCYLAGCDVHSQRRPPGAVRVACWNPSHRSRVHSGNRFNGGFSIGEPLLNADRKPRGGLAYASFGLSLGSFIEPI